MDLKFGDQILVKASPKLNLEISEAAEEWLIDLVNREQIDTDKDCLEFAQKIIKVLLNNGEIVHKEKFN